MLKFDEGLMIDIHLMFVSVLVVIETLMCQSLWSSDKALDHRSRGLGFASRLRP